MKAALTLALFFALALAATATASSNRAGALRVAERHLVRSVEQAKTTLRFFTRHQRLLYSHNLRVKRRAWHAVAVARQRVILGRRALKWTRKEIAHLSRPAIPHRAQWLCIRAYETPPPFPSWRTNSGNGFYGGLQMDLGFQRTYGAELLRAKGTADHWAPEEQMMVAERAYRGYREEKARGFSPWPNTARSCGLL